MSLCSVVSGQQMFVILFCFVLFLRFGNTKFQVDGVLKSFLYVSYTHYELKKSFIFKFKKFSLLI